MTPNVIIYIYFEIWNKIHFICYKYCYLQCTCWTQDRPAVDWFVHENGSYKFIKNRNFFEQPSAYSLPNQLTCPSEIWLLCTYRAEEYIRLLFEIFMQDLKKMDWKIYYCIDYFSYSKVLFIFTTSDGALFFKMSASSSLFSIIRFAHQAYSKLYRIIEKTMKVIIYIYIYIYTHTPLTNRNIKIDSSYSR